MAKYIIDTSRCYGYAYNETEKELEIYFQYLSDKPIRLKNVIPYTEPDRKAIEDETWELAERIADMSYEDFISCFEGETEEYVYGLPYHEVKAKYDAWKKRKEDEATMKEVVALAEKIGIHKLYSMVKEIRGEQE